MQGTSRMMTNEVYQDSKLKTVEEREEEVDEKKMVEYPHILHTGRNRSKITRFFSGGDDRGCVRTSNSPEGCCGICIFAPSDTSNFHELISKLCSKEDGIQWIRIVKVYDEKKCLVIFQSEDPNKAKTLFGKSHAFLANGSISTYLMFMNKSKHQQEEINSACFHCKQHLLQSDTIIISLCTNTFHFDCFVEKHSNHRCCQVVSQEEQFYPVRCCECHKHENGLWTCISCSKVYCLEDGNNHYKDQGHNCFMEIGRSEIWDCKENRYLNGTTNDLLVQIINLKSIYPIFTHQKNYFHRALDDEQIKLDLYFDENECIWEKLIQKDINLKTLEDQIKMINETSKNMDTMIEEVSIKMQSHKDDLSGEHKDILNKLENQMKFQFELTNKKIEEIKQHNEMQVNVEQRLDKIEKYLEEKVKSDQMDKQVDQKLSSTLASEVQENKTRLDKMEDAINTFIQFTDFLKNSISAQKQEQLYEDLKDLEKNRVDKNQKLIETVESIEPKLQECTMYDFSHFKDVLQKDCSDKADLGKWIDHSDENKSLKQKIDKKDDSKLKNLNEDLRKQIDDLKQENFELKAQNIEKQKILDKKEATIGELEVDNNTYIQKLHANTQQIAVKLEKIEELEKKLKDNSDMNTEIQEINNDLQTKLILANSLNTGYIQRHNDKMADKDRIIGTHVQSAAEKDETIAAMRKLIGLSDEEIHTMSIIVDQVFPANQTTAEAES